MKARKRIRVLFTVVLCLFVVTLGLGITVYALNGASEGTIGDGVYVNDIPLGGMTEEEAEQELSDYVQKLRNTKVIVSVDGYDEEETTLKVLGFAADSHSFIEEAASVGKSGNLINRYKALKDVEADPMEFVMTFGVQEDAIRSYVESLKERYDILAVDATLDRKNGEFIVTPHTNGRLVNVEESVERIKTAILEEWNQVDDIWVELVIEEDTPTYTEEDLLKVNSLLGSYTTDYATANAGRAQNVENGARLVDGSILYPGEVLSVDEKLRPYTVENGYGVGGAYVSGQVVDSLGGGICQVSTTLYNAALYAELEIVERAAHSMTVTYVPLSRDAAIAGDYKDLKFRNSLNLPIYVEGIAGNGKITFNIYGYETRDAGHTVDFEYEILETKKPGKDIVTEDSTKPASYEVVTQGSFTGYTTRLYKLTYEDGKLVERQQINTSYYQSSPRYVIRGTAKEEKEEEKEKEEGTEEGIEEEKKDKTDKDKTDKDKTKEEKPTDTSKTEQTEKPETEKNTETTTTITEKEEIIEIETPDEPEEVPKQDEATDVEEIGE